MISHWKNKLFVVLMAVLLVCLPLAAAGAVYPAYAAQTAVSLAVPSLTLSVGASYDCMVTAPLTGDLTIQVSNDCAVLTDGGKLTVEKMDAASV